MRMFKKAAWVTTGLVIIATSLGFVFKRQAINDWWILRSYEPPASIVDLADSISVTDDARHLFYVSTPQVNEAVEFSKNCTIAEASIVLGCYVDNTRIYIYNVTDPRLAGVQQVTAAHELLHVAYQRLSNSERERVDGLVLQAQSAITDTRLLTTIETYRKRDPSVVPNEVHSILATEVRNLPAELEEYYSQYFENRAQIVTHSEHYEAEFTGRRNRVGELDAQLLSLRSSIESDQVRLTSSYEVLVSQKQQLKTYLDADQINNYNALVPTFNQTVNSYNTLVTSISNDIDRFNVLVAERNLIAAESNELIKAIDSHPTTIQTQ